MQPKYGTFNITTGYAFHPCKTVIAFHTYDIILMIYITYGFCVKVQSHGARCLVGQVLVECEFPIHCRYWFTSEVSDEIRYIIETQILPFAVTIRKIAITYQLNQFSKGAFFPDIQCLLSPTLASRYNFERTCHFGLVLPAYI